VELKEFVEKYICKNTIIRLWKPIKGGHEMLHQKNDKEVCMEWELLKNEVWQSKYNENKVVGITDIITDTYREAVNIVIDI
jgi:iron uptake system EfeUOB component EfeO/EfeM